MRQFLLLMLAVSASTGMHSALAQSLPPAPSAMAPSNHPAVITFNATVLKTNEAQKDLGNLERKFAPEEARLRDLNNEVEGLKKQLDTAGDTLSDAERATRMQAFETKNKQLQREAEDYRNDSQTESQQIFQTVAQKVYAFLQDYAQRHGYSFVIERGSADNPIIWYAANYTDITNEVAQAYNAQSSIGAPATEPRTSKMPSSKQRAPTPGNVTPAHQ